MAGIYLYHGDMSREVFVSGQIDDLENVRAAQQKFIDAGHTITHDWTINETGAAMLSGREAKFANPEEAARRATNDINGVLNSDVYVLCSDNLQKGTGMYVELGAAIAAHEIAGKPRIYLVGQMNHATIFYFHPSIIVGRSVEQIIDEIKAS